MKIYKFKDLVDEKKHSHFYQIVLQGAIWCAKPDSLNDEDEFKFKLDYEPSSYTADLLSQVVARHSAKNFLPACLSVDLVLQNNRLKAIAAPIIDDVVNKCRNNIGITSFSVTKTDDHLWNEYGGKGNGACIEIEIPDKLIHDRYHPVCYVPEKIFHIDDFLRSYLLPDRAVSNYRNILLTKTKKWLQEEEIRFISKRPEVNLIIDGRINEITLGAYIPATTMKQVEDKIMSHCSTKGIQITKL